MSLDAMKQALRAAEFADLFIKELVTGSTNREVAKQVLSEAITALRAAIEQAQEQEQEPVAWMYHGIRHDDTPHERPSLIWKPEYMDVMSAEKGAKATPLYTAPRQWQGLTNDEIDTLYEAHHNQYGECKVVGYGYERAIEAKLKEKNA